MNKIEKMKRNQKIKETFFKCLHIISYILATLFIIIAVISGVKSCSKTADSKQSHFTESKQLQNVLKVKNNAFSYNSVNSFMYMPKWMGEKNINLDELMNYYNIPTGLGDYRTDRYTSLDLPSNTYVFIDGAEHNIVNLTLCFTPAEFTENGDNYYVLAYALFYFLEGGGDFFVELNSASINDNVYRTRLQPLSFKLNRIVFSNGVYDNFVFNFFYELTQPYYFQFNDPFNFNAPYEVSIEQSFIETGVNNIGVAKIIQFGNEFISNNQLFNRIIFHYSNASETYFQKSDGYYEKGPNTGIYFTSLEFQYYNGSAVRSVYVAYRTMQNIWVHTEELWSTSPLASVTWVNYEYRNLYFTPFYDDSLIDDLTMFNTNYNTSYTSNIGFGSDVFLLLGMAFASLSDFWSIMLLPGITIGTLFFLPLVVAVIMTVFYFVKR